MRLGDPEQGHQAAVVRMGRVTEANWAFRPGSERRSAPSCSARLRKESMNDVTARPNSLPWPPIIYVAAIAVSVLLNAFYPLPWFGRPLSGILFVLGWLMIAAFVALNISAIRAMRRAGTTVRPDRGTDHLVTTAPSPLRAIRSTSPARCLYWGLDWFRALCGFCSLRSSRHSRCKSSLSNERKGIYKRDSGRPIWIMPVACGNGFS
jgi:hypothetical protein